MAAKWNNHGKSSNSSDTQSKFSTPLKKRVVEALQDVENDEFGKEEASLTVDVNSDRQSCHAGATNLSSPSILSHFSTVNHSKEKPVDYCGNQSIEGHPGQSYETKDISLTCGQQTEVKPHVSYDAHSMFHPYHHSNHSMDTSNKHNGLFCYKDTKKQNDIRRCEENVWKEQSYDEELKLSSHASEKMDQTVEEGCLQSPRNKWQQINTFDVLTHQTKHSSFFKWEGNVAACNSQGKSSSGVDSSTCLLMKPFNSHAYKEDPIDKSQQSCDGNVTTPFEKNNRGDSQVLKCEEKEKRQAPVMEIYICSVCEKEFRQSGNFHNHMKSHTECPHYCKCGNCGSMYDSGEKLIEHMQKEHTGSNPYKCEHCDRDFSQLNNLRRHLHVHKEKSLKCQFCDRTFSENYYLKMHMGSHTGRRTFRCGVCTAKFTSSRELKNHVNNHPISELHVCDICKKCFGKACVLRQHKKAHTGKRPYKCEQCHKTFIHRHHLTMHMRSHTKSKPFTCETCGKEFSQTSHLNKHKRQHLVEAKLSKSSHEDSNGFEEKVINTLGNNSIPDELNGEPSNFQKKPKVKSDRKRSRGPKKDISDASCAYLLHASQISETRPLQSFSNPSMCGPLSNEANQNVMEQMNFPLPSHPTHYTPMYMTCAPDFMAAYIKNMYMMYYLSHSGQGLGNNYAEDLTLPKRNQFSCESPRLLSYLTDSSPTFISTRNALNSSASINQKQNQNFNNHTFTRPFDFFNFNMPVPVNVPVDLPRPTTQRNSKYDSFSENEVEDLSSRGNHNSNSPSATSIVSSQPDTLSHKCESSPIDHIQLASTSIMNPPYGDQKNVDMRMIKTNESRCDRPFGILGHTNSFSDDCLNQQQRKRSRSEAHYSSDMDFEKKKETLISSDITRVKAMEERKLEDCRELKVKDEKLDGLKEEAHAEEKQVEDNASQPEEISCLRQQIAEVREMIQHEIQREAIDAMIDSDEEEEGRLMIVEEDTEIQTQDSRTSNVEGAKIEKSYLGICTNEIFSQRMKHDWKRDALQRSLIGSMYYKSVVKGEYIHEIFKEKAKHLVSSNVRLDSGVDTYRGHSAVQTNSPFDILQPTATLPFQRVVNDLDTNDSSEMVIDLSMKHSPSETWQLHREQEGDDKFACPACLAPMDTESDLFKHLIASSQCYQLYFAGKAHVPVSNPAEETEIYFNQIPLEEPMDLTEKASSKMKSRTTEDFSADYQSKYHIFCKCCKEPMMNEVALSLHLSKNPRCFHSHYSGHSPVSLCKVDNQNNAGSGPLRHVMEPLSDRTSVPTKYRDNTSLKCDMVVTRARKGSQPYVPISSQQHLPGNNYRPVMAHYSQSLPSSQEDRYPVFSGRTLPQEQDRSLLLALDTKENSFAEPISSPRNCLPIPIEQKMGEEMRESVPTAEVLFCCGICYKKFATSSDFEAHQNEHVPQKDACYTCELCDNKFSRPLDFQCHMMTHTDAFGMHQYFDTTEEIRSLSTKKSIEQVQPFVNFSYVKTGIKGHYKCHVCGEVFEQVKFFHDHMGIHTGEKPYRCHVCSRGFPYKHNLNRHLMSHNAKTVLCSVCGRGFKGSFYLQMHMKIHAEEKNRRCEICGQHIPKSDLWQHIIAHLGTSDQNPTYNQIGERVKEILNEQKVSGDHISLSAFNEHLKKYLPLSEGIETQDDLMTLTAGFKNFQGKENDGANCEIKSSSVINVSNDDQKLGCGKQPEGKSQKKVEQVCLICNFVFKTKREFGNHLGVHNGERTHICKLCGKGFKKRCILRQHEKIHSNDRPFKCEVCGASFLHFHHLQIHTNVHNGDKSYKCHICGIGFKHSSNLPKHLEIHELESRKQSDIQSKGIQDSKIIRAEIESFRIMTDKLSRKKDRLRMTAEKKSLESDINHSIENMNLEQVITDESMESQSKQNVEDVNNCKSQKAKHPAPYNGDITNKALVRGKK